MKNNDVNGIPEILKQLNKFEYSRFKNTIFFRGHSDKKYSLKPNIYRDGIVANEDIIFKEILLRCPDDFVHCKNTFELLVKMQHYSLPTRLLDITTNPLIALFFACKSKQDVDGELLVFSVPNSEIKYYDSDTVSVISNLSKRPKDFKIPSKYVDEEENFLGDLDGKEVDITHFNNQRDIKFLLHEIRTEKPHFLGLIDPKHLSSVVCVKPKLDNPRVIKQDSAFFLFGMNEYQTKENPATFDTNYLLSKEKNKIIIEARFKKRIIDQLEILGITEATIFPEIEQVANYIKKIYRIKD